ncbi:MAG TPA: cobalamin-binding protein [Ignavibacteriaceae bacterium]|nr:cobalamin-binding protein [Ignavibacteriaceae bacterium]
MKTKYPERIICLTEETTELIYLLGAGNKIVGISGFTVRPTEARKTKPKVCTYLDANYDAIKKLKPDLIFTFSDMQAEIVKNLALQGYQVIVFNQRTIEEILQNILIIGSVVGKQKESEKLVKKYESRLKQIRRKSKTLRIHPKVYFEEWYDPMISGICWVSELIEIAGGNDIFGELRNKKGGKDRIVKPEEVIKRNPEIIIGSWCGKYFKKNVVKKREGWTKISAVKNNKLFEIKSSLILQPGPAAITEGLNQLVKIIHNN